MNALIPVGFFREMRHGRPDGPSLVKALSDVPASQEEKIVRYLQEGVLFIGSLGIVSDVLDPNSGPIGSPDILTDGRYAWPTDVAYYVEKYHVRLPDDFLRHMRKNNWHIPTNIDVQDLSLGD